MKSPIKILSVVLVAGVLVFGVGATVRNPDRTLSFILSLFDWTSKKSQDSGIVEINDTSWCAPIVSLSSKTRIDVKILTNDVWWRARLDGDNRRIVELYPGNWVSDKHVEVGEFNSIELCLKPNQSVRTAKIAWTISPKKTGS